MLIDKGSQPLVMNPGSDRLRSWSFCLRLCGASLTPVDFELKSSEDAVFSVERKQLLRPVADAYRTWFDSVAGIRRLRASIAFASTSRPSGSRTPSSTP